jgi:sigma-B regulation protein RsbU (phosphoserine phosphatase)
MLEALNADKDAPVEALLRNVRRAVSDFADGAVQFDDITMMAVEYNGKDAM